ncbi:uncharacterized protein LOC142328260 [Lycorma delicatula]|uniref:uncharacterized protein LOC142328260 n=1 Tax=Lycorma delicatula TaxID=130591 RepID=UPI003F515419
MAGISEGVRLPQGKTKEDCDQLFENFLCMFGEVIDADIILTVLESKNWNVEQSAEDLMKLQCDFNEVSKKDKNQSSQNNTSLDYEDFVTLDDLKNGGLNSSVNVSRATFSFDNNWRPNVYSLDDSWKKKLDLTKAVVNETSNEVNKGNQVNESRGDDNNEDDDDDEEDEDENNDDEDDEDDEDDDDADVIIEEEKEFEIKDDEPDCGLPQFDTVQTQFHSLNLNSQHQPSSSSANYSLQITEFLNNLKQNNKDAKIDIKKNKKPVVMSNKSSPKNIFLTNYDQAKKIKNDSDRIYTFVVNGVKVLVFMRGCPGSGKSHTAEAVIKKINISCAFDGKLNYSGHVFSTDDFFKTRFGYNYNSNKLSEAHLWNQKRVEKALKHQKSPIIVDNTNTQLWEMEPYAVLAVAHGYVIEILEPNTKWKFNENELYKRNTHSVPKKQIKIMLDRYECNITGDKLLKILNLKYSSNMKPPQPIKSLNLKDEPKEKKKRVRYKKNKVLNSKDNVSENTKLVENERSLKQFYEVTSSKSKNSGRVDSNADNISTSSASATSSSSSMFTSHRFLEKYQNELELSSKKFESFIKDYSFANELYSKLINDTEEYSSKLSSDFVEGQKMNNENNNTSSVQLPTCLSSTSVKCSPSNLIHYNGIYTEKRTPDEQFNENFEVAKNILNDFDRIFMLILNKVKTLVLLRGCPGSGKTYIAEHLINKINNSQQFISVLNYSNHVFSADDYFNTPSGYVFDRLRLSDAHLWVQENVNCALKNDISPVIVDNCNIESLEMKPFIEMALMYGFHIEILEPDTEWKFDEFELTKRNVHFVSITKIRYMLDRFERDITVDKLLEKYDLQYPTNMKPPQQSVKKGFNSTASDKDIVTSNFIKVIDKVETPNENQEKISFSIINKSISNEKMKINSIQFCSVFHTIINEFKNDFDRISVLILCNVKVMVLMRGCHSIGKTYTAHSLIDKINELSKNYRPLVYLEHIFNSDKKFTFNSYLQYPDVKSQKRVLEAIRYNKNPIIIDNCNIIVSEMKPYVEMAVNHGYYIEVLEPDTKWKFDEDELLKRNAHFASREDVRNWLKIYERDITGRKLLKMLNLSYHPELVPQINEEVYIDALKILSFSKARQNNVSCEVAPYIFDNTSDNLDKENNASFDIQSVETNCSDNLFKNDKESLVYRNCDSLKNNYNTLMQNDNDDVIFTERGSSICDNLSPKDEEQKIALGEGTVKTLISSDSSINKNIKKMQLMSMKDEEQKITLGEDTIKTIIPSNSSINKNVKEMDLISAKDEEQKIALGEETVKTLIYSDSSINKNVKEMELINEPNVSDNVICNISNHSSLGSNIYTDGASLKSDVTSKDFILIKNDGTIFSSVNETEVIEKGNVHNLKQNTHVDDISSYFMNSIAENAISNKDVGLDSKLEIDNLDEKESSKDSTIDMKENDNNDNSASNDTSDKKIDSFSTSQDCSGETTAIFDSEESHQEVATIFSVKEELKKINVIDWLIENKSSNSGVNINNIKEDNNKFEFTDSWKSWEAQHSSLEQLETAEVEKEDLPKPPRTSIKTRVPDPSNNIVLESEIKTKNIPKEFLGWSTVPDPHSDWFGRVKDTISGTSGSHDQYSKPQRQIVSENSIANQEKATILDISSEKENEIKNSFNFSSTSAKNSCVQEDIVTLLTDVMSSNVSKKQIGNQDDKEEEVHQNERGSSSEERDNDSDVLSNMFPHVASIYLNDLLEKCQGDMNWAAEILLEESHEEGDSFTSIPIQNLSHPSTENDEVSIMERSSSDVNVLNPSLDQSSKSFKKGLFTKSKKCYNKTSVELKKLIEKNIVLNASNYSENILKIIKRRRGENFGDPSNESGIRDNKLKEFNQDKYPISVTTSQGSSFDLFSQSVHDSNQHLEEASNESENVEKVEDKEENASGFAVAEIENDKCETDSFQHSDEDDSLKFVLSKDFMSTLLENFGSPGLPPHILNTERVVELPKSLARQIHSYMMDSIQLQMEEEENIMEKMISEDEEFARRLQQEEHGSKEGHFHRRTNSPKLQEIIDMETALALCKVDTENQREKKESKETFAARLGKGILLEKFPDVDQRALLDLYNTNNNSLHNTVATLLMNRESETDLDVWEHQLLEKAKQESQRGHDAVDYQNENEFLENSPRVQKNDEQRRKEALNDWEYFREEAVRHHIARNDCFNKAKEAYKQGNKSAAAYYSQLANLHMKCVEQANSRAATALLSAHRSSSEITLDLHFYQVKEALEVLNLFLDSAINRLKEKQKSQVVLYIITGRGLHSTNGKSKLRPVIMNKLKSLRIPCTIVNPGMLSIVVTKNTPLSNSS